MSKNVVVSVCVMTFNQVEHIGQCLESILTQSCDFNFEVIVGDDCSTDGTREIIAEFARAYPGVVKPIYQCTNVGSTRNYISVHSAATAEFVAHCDGDDFWYPGKLQFQVDLMRANPQLAQSWCCADIVDDSGNKLGLFPSRLARVFYPERLDASDIALSYGLVGQHSTQIYRRSFQPAFDPDERLLDYWIAFQIALHGPSHYSKNVFSAYRVSKRGSLTNTSQPKKFAVDVLGESLVRLVDRYPQFAEQAKANAWARYVLSRVRGHDLTVIRASMQLLAFARFKFFLWAKACAILLLQKL